MAFRAVGAALVRLPSGLLQITVDYFADSEPDHAILSQAYVVADKDALIAKVTAQLTSMKQAQDEATAQLNIIGKLLGSI
jgi:hypothetical protein